MKRFYPKRTLAAQVLGYVGMEDTGLAGIEYLYQNQLNGVKGRVVITVDARRKWFGHMEHPPEPGSNVVLTIDEKIQFIAEQELEKAMQRTQAVSGTVVVQNPRTGEILALANAPSFNPNLTHEITPEKLRDHALSDVYEPGSVFKTVTYSSAFEEKLASRKRSSTAIPAISSWAEFASATRTTSARSRWRRPTRSPATWAP